MTSLFVPAQQVCAMASKALCVTRNYVAHAAELGNPLPQEPIFFTKTSNAFVPMSPSFSIPDRFGACHHELELVLVMAKTIGPFKPCAEPLTELISAVALGLDLTLREEQSHLKAQALPWDFAKSFDGSAPVSDAVQIAELKNSGLQCLSFDFEVNGELRQRGYVADMVFDIQTLLQEISTHMSLFPGDLVFTGTPAGVGPLHAGDQVQARLLCSKNSAQNAANNETVQDKTLLTVSSEVRPWE